jgi:hypothetical protein
LVFNYWYWFFVTFNLRGTRNFNSLMLSPDFCQPKKLKLKALKHNMIKYFRSTSRKIDYLSFSP